MSLTLYAHPFAAYCWKVLIALYENATPFTYRLVEDEAGWAELASLWPIKKFPLLRDGVHSRMPHCGNQNLGNTNRDLEATDTHRGRMIFDQSVAQA